MNDQLKTFLTVTNLAKIQHMAFSQKERYKQKSAKLRSNKQLRAEKSNKNFKPNNILMKLSPKHLSSEWSWNKNSAKCK